MDVNRTIYNYTVLKNDNVEEIRSILADPAMTARSKHTCLYVAAIMNNIVMLRELINDIITDGDELLFTKVLHPGAIEKTSYPIIELLQNNNQTEFINELVEKFNIDLTRNPK